ncbi:hypothetical protein LbFV_ORF24 [Leptopilina boulardi filamentous virus]|uniref:Uncharacterized protein n=1 Tax=Leptopilina boulardi filamentous virus TaxID=552509 RepID=A0A1S5YD76_9VIRU|nr:hypothetical protein LbFV_ORF24 [Leptopilina boulardi filamentous virus]AQQ79944.1 hypothetical protein LbFV_ORF24 [Leptopilina boulardi filamentous virus]
MGNNDSKGVYYYDEFENEYIRHIKELCDKVSECTENNEQKCYINKETLIRESIKLCKYFHNYITLKKNFDAQKNKINYNAMKERWNPTRIALFTFIGYSFYYLNNNDQYKFLVQNLIKFTELQEYLFNEIYVEYSLPDKDIFRHACSRK